MFALLTHRCIVYFVTTFPKWSCLRPINKFFSALTPQATCDLSTVLWKNMQSENFCELRTKKQCDTLPNLEMFTFTDISTNVLGDCTRLCYLMNSLLPIPKLASIVKLSSENHLKSLKSYNGFEWKRFWERVALHCRMTVRSMSCRV